MSATILYADDEIRFHKLVELFLSQEGYNVISFSGGEELIDYLCEKPAADLVLLDLMMPGMDGWETCREIREKFSIPVIMLTALSDESSEVRGINTGADDYIGKPFSRDRLVARVNALLRRTAQQRSKALMDEGMVLREEESAIELSGRKINLSPKEFGLLEYLVINKSSVLSRMQLLDHVWGYDYCGDPRTVDTHIKSLRARLGEEGRRITTVRGKGYCYKGMAK